MSAVLFLCRANVCRSVMAQALLSARLAERGVPVAVASAGLLADSPLPRYQATAELFGQLTAEPVGRAWPDHGTAPQSPGTVREKRL